MWKIEQAIIEAMRNKTPTQLSQRDDVRYTDGGIMVYRLWDTDIASLALDGTYTELITDHNQWYYSRLTQSRLRALRAAFAR